MIELTTSQLNDRMQQLDEELAFCLDSFFADTDVAIDTAVINYQEEKGYGITLGLRFPEE